MEINTEYSLISLPTHRHLNVVVKFPGIDVFATGGRGSWYLPIFTQEFGHFA